MNSSEKAVKASVLRNLISTNCPVINKANWDFMTPKGWRWHGNIHVEDNQALKIVRDLQIRCGTENVTMGHMFDKSLMHPRSDSDMYGVYIRDIDDLVQTLVAKLDDTGLLEEWLNNDPVV